MRRWLLVPILVLTAAVAHAEQPSVPVTDSEVVRGDPEQPNLALVFNVGAGFEPATSILDSLAEKDQRATFFVMGWWAERHPEVLRDIADRGHEIASHGHRIFDLTLASDAEVQSDLETADATIAAVIGRTTRPLWSPSAGYRPILWTVDSGDWTTEATPESVYSHVLNGAGNGAIIVLHFDSPNTLTSTALVLPHVIDALRDSGYRLVTVTELLTQ